MSREAWSAFWLAERGTGCLTGAPPAVTARLESEWRSFADRLGRGSRVLDVAAGAGAVMRLLRTARPDLDVVGVDYAAVGPAAVPGLRGGIDAAALPFAASSFDGLTSQFGIEYCPPAALDEVMRVLRPGGHLLFLCHHAAGPAVSHNRARLAAMTALREAGLFDLAAQVARGEPESAAHAAAVADVRRRHAAQRIVEELPVALGHALRGPRPEAAVAGLRAMATAEEARLSAMANAALDETGVRRLADRLAERASVTLTTVAVPGEQPIAWAIAAIRNPTT